ncbi:PPR repeat [Musa troglodytarum]|uniref:PPR repeat n=1 Tax=Musa troglodytarum TaxID=320322 RepID=A0A9E7GAA7_9LILI|nr:PPR repeat [Musa troglodytarum]
MWRKLRYALFCGLLERPSPPILCQRVRLSGPFSTCSDSTWSLVSTSDMGNRYQRDKVLSDSGSKSLVRIGKSVLSRCFYLCEKKADTSVEESSLQDILRVYADISPETTRRFWRVSVLRPEDFLEILLGIGNGDCSLRKVEFLLKLFRWAKKQSADFDHLPRSYEVMISVLIRAQMYEDAESLLLGVESREIFSNSAPLFSGIIQGYAEDCKLEKAMVLFDKARERGTVPSASCFQSLLSLLAKKKKVELVTKVYMDMIKVGLASYSQDFILKIVIVGLTKNERILEAITLLRQLRCSGTEASHFALSAIAEGLCKKKDFEDMFNFLEEWGHAPDVHICNKIISSLCIDLGIQESWSFMQRMEVLGFKSDAITFSILICHSCRARKLRDGYIYLSECLSRGIVPTVYIYNALISAGFMEGLHRHANDVFEDMLEKGIMPDQTTFKILLAGYCKYRKFDEVKRVLIDMRNRCLTSLTSLEDSLSKALIFLGLDHLKVKIKRDNNVGIPRSEFFDCLGNGLYLDTDVEEYETSLAGILDSAIVPGFDSQLMRGNDKVNIQIALKTKDELTQWGQNLSLSTYSKLFRHLCATPHHLKEAICLLDDIPESLELLDGETLNLLLKNLSKNGMVAPAMMILERLFKRKLLVESQSFMELIVGLSKERDIDGLRECCNQAYSSMWLPSSKDLRPLFSSLCRWGLIKEVLELFDRILENCPALVSSLCTSVLKELCMTGYTIVGCILVEELLERNLVMDHAPFVYISMGFLKEQQLVESLGILDILHNKNVTLPINICQHIIPLLLRFNRFEEAIALKESVLARKPDRGYRSLVRQMLLKGLISHALRLKDLIQQKDKLVELNMQHMRIHPDKNTYDFLVHGFHKCGEVIKSVEALDTIIFKGWRPSNRSLRIVICQFCNDGKLEKALELSKLMEHNKWKHGSVIQNELAMALLRCGGLSEAELFLDRVAKKGLIPANIDYNNLIQNLCMHSGIQNAVDLLNVMLKKGNLPSEMSYSSVIHGLCDCKAFDEALDFHAEMLHQNLQPSVEVCNALVNGLCANWRTDDARRILRTMLQYGPPPTYSMYSHVLDCYHLNNNLDKASELLQEMQVAGHSPNFETHWSLISNLSSLEKKSDDGDKSILSGLLCGSRLPVMNSKSKVASAFK